MVLAQTLPAVLAEALQPKTQKLGKKTPGGEMGGHSGTVQVSKLRHL